MTVQEIINAESEKLCDAADALSRGEITDAAAILKGISALTGTVAAVALAFEPSIRMKGESNAF